MLKINPQLHSIQFHNIVQVLRPEQSPEGALAKMQSLTKRTQMTSRPSRDLKDLLDSLGRWVSTAGSALFVVNVALRAEIKAKEFAVDVIKLLQDMSCGVMWNISMTGSQRKPALPVEMIKNLVFQVLVHDPAVLHNFPAELDATKFLSTHTEAEWASLLSKLLSRIPKCFLVIEAHDIFQFHRGKPEWAGAFFQLFQDLVDKAEGLGNILKILVLGYDTRALTSQNLSGSSNRIVSSIQRPVPVPQHLRRRFGIGRKKATGWQQLRARF